jgi:hypothetical protein
MYLQQRTVYNNRDNKYITASGGSIAHVVNKKWLGLRTAFFTCYDLLAVCDIEAVWPFVWHKVAVA